MATSKQYAWYLEGNKIALVEKDVSFDNDVDSKDYGPGASRQRWKSPQSSINDGLEIAYTYAPTTNIQDEESIIDLPIYLQKALVYYVKSKLAEDAANIEVKLYFDREFKKMIEKYENTRISGLRIISPGLHSIR